MSLKRPRDDDDVPMAAAAVVPVQPDHVNGQHFATLPDDVMNHVANILPMRDFLKLRGVSSQVYNRIELRGKQQACLARLKPGLVTQLRMQRKHRLVYLGLRLTSPPTEAETDALTEFEGLRGVKSLELHMTRNRQEVRDAIYRDSEINSDFDSEVDSDVEEDNHYERKLKEEYDRRAKLAGDVATHALALGLESICFRGSPASLTFIAPCVLANRDTLQHLVIQDLSRDVVVVHDAEFNAFVKVLLRLSSLRLYAELPGVTQEAKNPHFINDEHPFTIPSVSGKQVGQPTWRYLSLGPVFDTYLFPFALPDTLQGLSLSSSRNIQWTCPPRAEFLHILTSTNLLYFFDTHIPPHHATLAQLILDVSLINEDDEHEEHSALDAFRTWLDHATLPAFETFAVRMDNIDFRMLTYTLEYILAVSQRFPHLRRIYIEIEGLEEESVLKRKPRKSAKQRAALAIHDTLSAMRRDIKAPTQFIEGPLPDLEANFLLRHNLSTVSPCTDANVLVERGYEDNDNNINNNQTQRIIHLRPHAHVRDGVAKRRKTQQE
jgi:hypothetical protein